jgi:hypothetical protein
MIAMSLVKKSALSFDETFVRDLVQNLAIAWLLMLSFILHAVTM